MKDDLRTYQRDSIELLLCDTQLLWEFHTVYDTVANADAVICLGSYDFRVADRCAELLMQQVAPLAVVTGGFGNWTRGVFKKPEAELFSEHIQSRGVPGSKLLIEPNASNIGENISLSRELLASRNVRTVVLVTKPQTQRRVFATLPIGWSDVKGLVTAPIVTLLEQAKDHIGFLALVAEMVGDLQRLIEYPKFGYQANVEIPIDVLVAYNRLKNAGFSQHCIAADPQHP
jgi:uncharacterized SAM-binding protein YcdF (DUF218 family)